MTIVMGNPASLGLIAFGMSVALLMYVEMGWVETSLEETIAGYAICLGGLCQLLVAIFELIKGSSFSFAVLGVYGAFWLALGLVLFENARTDSTFGSTPYPNGKAANFASWGFMTSCFLVITTRKNRCLMIVFALLALTFYVLAAAAGTGSTTVQKIGGYIGFGCALSAFYTGIAELVNEEWGRHVLPGLEPMYRPERLEIKKVVDSLITYDRRANTLLLSFRGLSITSLDDVNDIRDAVENKIKSVHAPGDRVHVIVDYNETTISDNIVDDYWAMATDLQTKYYLSGKRFHVSAFGHQNPHGTELVGTSRVGDMRATRSDRQKVTKGTAADTFSERTEHETSITIDDPETTTTTQTSCQLYNSFDQQAAGGHK